MTQEQAAKEEIDAATAAFEEKHLPVHETDIQCEGRCLHEGDIHHLESMGSIKLFPPKPPTAGLVVIAVSLPFPQKILNDNNLSVVLAFARSRARE